MNISYDPVADAMIIRFDDSKNSTSTDELGEGFLVDYNNKKLISLEILDVSKKLSTKSLGSVTVNLSQIGSLTA